MLLCSWGSPAKGHSDRRPQTSGKEFKLQGGLGLYSIIFILSTRINECTTRNPEVSVLLTDGNLPKTKVLFLKYTLSRSSYQVL